MHPPDLVHLSPPHSLHPPLNPFLDPSDVNIQSAFHDDSNPFVDPPTPARLRHIQITALDIHASEPSRVEHEECSEKDIDGFSTTCPHCIRNQSFSGAAYVKPHITIPTRSIPQTPQPSFRALFKSFFGRGTAPSSDSISYASKPEKVINSKPLSSGAFTFEIVPEAADGTPDVASIQVVRLLPGSDTPIQSVLDRELITPLADDGDWDADTIRASIDVNQGTSMKDEKVVVTRQEVYGGGQKRGRRLAKK